MHRNCLRVAATRGFTRRGLTVLSCGAMLAACGGSPSAPPPTDAAATITITSSGLSPREVRVPRSARVQFVNDDTRQHAVSSDPVNTHTDCPAVNEVGTLAPGQRRTTGRLTDLRACGFHDHNNETDPTWKGRIIVE